MSSATSSAADPLTTNTFRQPADAVTFSSTPAARRASCRSHNQKIQAARHVANGVRRNIGAEYIACSACHTRHNSQVLHGPPGAPRWLLPPVSMQWFGKSISEICAQIKDPERNGDRPIAKIAEHIEHDELVRWGCGAGTWKGTGCVLGGRVGRVCEAVGRGRHSVSNGIDHHWWETGCGFSGGATKPQTMRSAYEVPRGRTSGRMVQLISGRAWAIRNSQERGEATHQKSRLSRQAGLVARSLW